MHKLAMILQTIWRSEQNAYPRFQAVLKLVSGLYTAWMRLRAHIYRLRLRSVHKLPCFVISIGNLSVGGTGKTPMARYLAAHLTAQGYRVVVISRGYRGRLEKQGGVVSDGCTVLAGVRDSSDEPQILARLLKGVPVIVGGNRYLAGQRAVQQFNPDVILLDDAFQHIRLHRDLDIVLLDCKRPFGNGYTLPAGELRESARALRRSHAVVLTRCPAHDKGQPPHAYDRLSEFLAGPIFQSRHKPVIRDLSAVRGAPRTENALTGRRVFAFSGLAKNEDFLYTLSGFNCEVVGSTGFPDHHFYGKQELTDICKRAQELAANCIVTTDKDYVKVEHMFPWPLDVVVLGIDISFGDDTARFQAWLDRRLPDRKN